jgi:hypothetical protein
MNGWATLPTCPDQRSCGALLRRTGEGARPHTSYGATGTRTGVSGLHGAEQVPGFAVGFVDSLAAGAFGAE